MPNKAYVIGVGMTKFIKPRGLVDYPEMALEAATKALLDAGITYDQIQQAFVGYCYGESTSGQRALYQLGMTMIPIVNVNNNCSTGSTALFQARQLIEGGIIDCAMALGFEKMAAGSLTSTWNDRAHPGELFLTTMAETRGFEPKAPGAPQMFGNAGLEYMEKYGATSVHAAKIAEKNHRHSSLNPYSQFRDVYTLDQILSSPKLFGPLTKLQCCPTSDGAACVVLVSEAFVRRHKLEDQAIEIVAQAMTTDSADFLKTKSAMGIAGFDMTKRAADEVYRKSGVRPEQCGVVELHDCFSTNELITYDALGLCAPGEAHGLVDSGDNTFGGKFVVNPSGGLISKGHPLGATGLAQCSELVWQLRGWAGERQVPNLQYALQHNIGIGGAAVVTIYKKANGNKTLPRVGYNPAVEARPVSEDDVKKVAARENSIQARL